MLKEIIEQHSEKGDGTNLGQPTWKGYHLTKPHCKGARVVRVANGTHKYVCWHEYPDGPIGSPPPAYQPGGQRD